MWFCEIGNLVDALSAPMDEIWRLVPVSERIHISGCVGLLFLFFRSDFT
jgi:hypothetical protein